MHTFQYPCTDKYDNDVVVRIHHNGDYSGDALVTIEMDGQPNSGQEMWVPCAALIALAGDAVSAALIEALEQADFPFDPSKITREGKT